MGLGLCGWILNDRDRILGEEGQQINHITDPGGWGVVLQWRMMLFLFWGQIL